MIIQWFKRLLSDEGGIALPAALILTTVGVTLGAALYVGLSVTVSTQARTEDQMRALYAAESGVNQTIYWIQHPEVKGFTLAQMLAWIPANQASSDWTSLCGWKPAPGGGYERLTSCDNVHRHERYQTWITCSDADGNLIGADGKGDCANASLSDLHINLLSVGQTALSASGSAQGGGGGVTAQGATAQARAVSVKLEPSTSANGQDTELDPVMPDLDNITSICPTESGGATEATYAKLKGHDTWTLDEAAYYYGDMSLSGNSSINVTHSGPVTFYVNSLSMNGNPEITVAGPDASLTICVDGDMSMKGNGEVTNGGDSVLSIYIKGDLYMNGTNGIADVPNSGRTVIWLNGDFTGSGGRSLDLGYDDEAGCPAGPKPLAFILTGSGNGLPGNKRIVADVYAPERSIALPEDFCGTLISKSLPAGSETGASGDAEHNWSDMSDFDGILTYAPVFKQGSWSQP